MYYLSARVQLVHNQWNLVPRKGYMQRNIYYYFLYRSVLATDCKTFKMQLISPGGGGTPYNGLYGEDPPERGTFSRLQV